MENLSQNKKRLWMLLINFLTFFLKIFLIFIFEWERNNFISQML